MPAKDKYHNQVKEALEKDGWFITHDPYFLKLGRRKGYIDLGAERTLIGAEKGSEKIAVEIKSFIGLSNVKDFQEALGQFLLYKPALAKKSPSRTLYLSIPEEFFDVFFDDPYFLEVTDLYDVKMIVVDTDKNKIVKWKK